METPHRIPRPAITVSMLLLLVAVSVAWTAPLLAGAPTEQPAPTITYVGDPTPEQRAVVEWAVARFEMAGLTLADVEVSFPHVCGGKGGRYFVGQGRIELCRVNKITALHELAHAWDDAGAVVDRDGFMERRGLDHWVVRHGHKPVESGGEQLAQIVAWGLMDLDTTVRHAAHDDHPRDQHDHRIPGLPMSSVDELHAEFVTLTGVAPLHENAGA